jgi:hypothetical protein
MGYELLLRVTAPLRLDSAAAAGARSAAGSPTPRADRAPARGEKSAFEMLIRFAPFLTNRFENGRNGPSKIAKRKCRDCMRSLVTYLGERSGHL